MTGVVALILKGLALGLGAAVPIGPVNVEIARRTLRQGFRYGVAIGAGAVTVDVTYAIVASVGWAPLIGKGWIETILGMAGVMLLLYLAGMCFRGVGQAIRARGVGDGEAEERSAVRTLQAAPRLTSTYLTGLLMTFFNPMTLAFWFVVLPALAAKLTDRPRHDLPFLCFGVFLGAFGWAVSFAAVLAILGRFRRDLWALAADAVGGLVLLAFALLAAKHLIQPLL